MKKNILLIILLSVSNIKTYAQESKQNPIDISFGNCHWETTLEWGDCITKHQLMWEEELEKNYQKLKSVLKGGRLKLLELSQSNWEAYYLSKKEFIVGDIDIIKRMGSMTYMQMCQSLMYETRSRALELAIWYDNLPR